MFWLAVIAAVVATAVTVTLVAYAVAAQDPRTQRARIKMAVVAAIATACVVVAGTALRRRLVGLPRKWRFDSGDQQALGTIFADGVW